MPPRRTVGTVQTMQIPRWMTRVNRVVTNPVLGLLSDRVPPLATLHHVGRTSGRRYRTPVMAFRTPRGYRDADDPAGPPMFDPAGKLTLHRRNWLLFQSGDAHTRLRKLIMNVFTPRAIRAITPRIATLVDELLAPVFERGSLEVIGDLAYPLPATVICELLGIPAADRDVNREWTNKLAPTIDRCDAWPM